MKTKKNILIIAAFLLLFAINSNAQTNTKDEKIKSISLNEKFYGCILGVYIGSSMGAAVEGMSYIPARDIGKYCDYAGLNSFARACHPIGQTDYMMLSTIA